MSSPSRSAGTVTLMGSGELTRPMGKVHRSLLRDIEGPVRAVFLDTPAGFELNADDISSKACEYVERHLGVPCPVASFKVADRATKRDIASALRKLRLANYILAGPGSPTYAVRNWRGTPVLELVARRVGEGAQLVLASAAAIAMGRYALPVYEIYKVGEEPHWVDGLDLLAPYGLELAIVTHWNNTEGGTFDTRYCYMGQPRFDALERQLPDSSVVLGIDEYTACILDLGRGEGRVMGAGQVTIRSRDGEKTFQTGMSFGLDLLRPRGGRQGRGARRTSPVDSAGRRAAVTAEALVQAVARARQALVDAETVPADPVVVAQTIYDLAQATEEARQSGTAENLISEAEAGLRECVAGWYEHLPSSNADVDRGISALVELLVELRSRARAGGDWGTADEIRERLSGLGIVLEDGPSETTWRKR